ncbi:MAG: beta-ketoacyl synthase N-terminal-like domain-containing protein [Gemmatimonadales bacterium]
MNGRAVWVTGRGAVTAAGMGAGRLLEALLGARSAVRPHSDLAGLPVGRAERPSGGAASRRLDRSAALFLAAAEEAWRDAGLPDDAIDLERCGLIEGSCLGPLADALMAVGSHAAADGRQAIRPSGLVRFMPGAGGAAFAHGHRLRGPVLYLSAGSVSSSCAIVEALEKITIGLLDVVVTGGAECPLHPDVIESFRVAGVLAAPRDGDPVCCPFDDRRTGTVLGEGAGVMVLEAAEHATRRGARPYGVVTGFGFSRETYSMIRPEPTGAGVAQAARVALGEIPLQEVGWIKAHGTGTRINDAAEYRGLAALFGNRLPGTPIASLKPMLGHCLGASGAVETVAALLALELGMIPPTLGTGRVDPALPMCTVATRAERSSKSRALILAESFAGRCAAIAMSRA